MKRENLYIVGGALLATTALSTAATAGTFTLTDARNQNTVSLSTAQLTLSAQVFGTTPSAAQTLGAVGLFYRFNQPMTSKFTLVMGLTGAKFNTGATSSASADVRGFATGTLTGTSTVTTLGATASTLGCQVAVALDKIALTDCTPNGTGISITGILVSQVVFDNATGLATSGATIALDATVTVGSVNFESTASQAVIKSGPSAAVTATAATGLSLINVNATPAFAKFVDGSITTVIGSIGVTSTGALGADLSSVINTAAQTHNGANVKLTSTIFTQAATKAVRVLSNGAQVGATSQPTDFIAGSATFSLTQANVGVATTFVIQVEFNGTTAIADAAAGTIDFTFAAVAAPAAASTNVSAPPGLAAAAGLAGIARNGLTIDVNGVQPGTAQGLKTYTSLLRIANTGTAAGTISVRLVNENTGATLGTYTSPSIASGASFQVSSATMESGAGITPVASITYRATVTGSITGYVQHVNWNQDAGFFSDLSGRRNSTNGTNN